MTNNNPTSRERRALSVRPGDPTYEVGYGKPPASTRFRPGQSGNPKGRPRGRKNKPPALSEERLQSIILDEAYRAIKVNDGDRQVSVPMAQAIVRSLAVTAAKGNTRAQKLFAELLLATETSRRRLHDAWLEAAIVYKTEWDKELERRVHRRIIAPDPLPHPDDVVIDYQTGAVNIRGPMSKEQLADLDTLLDRQQDFEAELLQLEQDINDPACADHRHILEGEISHAKRVLDIVAKALATRASETAIRRRKAQRSVLGVAQDADFPQQGG